MLETLVAITAALLLIGLAWAGATGRVARWFRRIMNGDTRVIIEPPAKRGAVRCGKCQCKFTYTARDVTTTYRESHVYCPGCKQRLRIWTVDGSEAFGISDDG
jgi:hypothetical protein